MSRKDVIPVCGSMVLALPLAFIVSCLLGHPLFPTVLGNPALLIGCLFVPIAVSIWTIAEVRIVPGSPAILNASLELRPPSLLVASAGSLMSLILMGYLILENTR
jgi:hypothetical protein